ncbi:hypothetical protein [Reinekea marinisedimentorum]|uniref:Nucleotidyltransferase AbiEii toxin of type IV toxin-antitoxin system n=1 Tax=Reinekea marinisedimentorum TaxID=230495 RepID=A0A4R3HS97_9GAMM|nr:hypothetical protein [Reinekea marinisedimentorum]TCS35202.1 hypothetical protein BCF53_1367 [Reinekea marinisedimentorum]
MWHKVIPEICKKLEELDVRYHADASSSLFVCGFEFEMEDFDVTVEWGTIEIVRNAFESLNPTQVSGTNPKQFRFEFMGRKIDVMSYESDTGIGAYAERQLIEFSGAKIWTKIPSFYLSRMRKDHPVRNAALRYFKS